MFVCFFFLECCKSFFQDWKHSTFKIQNVGFRTHIVINSIEVKLKIKYKWRKLFCFQHVLHWNSLCVFRSVLLRNDIYQNEYNVFSIQDSSWTDVYRIDPFGNTNLATNDLMLTFKIVNIQLNPPQLYQQFRWIIIHISDDSKQLWKIDVH